jgi:hypothetical protein
MPLRMRRGKALECFIRREFCRRLADTNYYKLLYMVKLPRLPVNGIAEYRG